MYAKKSYIWNPSTGTCENGKYLGSIIDDSVITYDKIVEVTKIVPSKATPKKVTYKFEDFFILLVFLLITISLLIIISV